MKNTVFVVVIVLSLCSCRDNSSRTSNTLDSRTADELVDIALSRDNKADPLDIVAETQIIRLDSKNGSIGRIKNTIVTDNNIVISDENSVFVFDRQGVSQARISRLGRGPEDYLQLTHMTLTPEGDKIAIYDNHGNKVLYFSLNGEYLFSAPAKFWFSQMEFTSSDEIVCVTYGLGKQDPGLKNYRNNEDLIYFLNDELEIDSSTIPLRHDREKFKLISPILRRFGERVYINPVYSDTIYLARDNVLEAKYHVDMSGIGGEANFADKITDAEFDALVKRASTFSGFFVDSDNYLLLSVSTPPERRIDIYLYSKKKGCIYKLEQTSTALANIIKYNIVTAKTSYKDKFVSVIDAYRIASILEKIPDAIPELAGMEIKEEDNPIVVFYTLKDNL